MSTEPEPPTQPAIKPPDSPTKIHPVVEFLWKEWRVLKSPSFYIAVGIAAIAIFIYEERFYAETIREKEATIGQKDATITTVSSERDTFKDYNDKLSRENDQLRVYRGKDAPPLKQNALILARQINEYVKDWKDSDDQYHNSQKYVERFGQRVVIMRDDLDQNGQDDKELDKVVYDFQGSRQEVKKIADLIEKLANNLPD